MKVNGITKYNGYLWFAKLPRRDRRQPGIFFDMECRGWQDVILNSKSILFKRSNCSGRSKRSGRTGGSKCSERFKPSNPQTLKPLNPQTLKPLNPQTLKPSNP